MPHQPGHERPPPVRRTTPRDRRRRALGQNFLAEPVVAARLVALAQLRPGDLVLDLGAGRGALTAPLAAASGRVVAVERDPAWARALRRRFAGDPRVAVVEDDLLGIVWPSEPFTVVGNLPFGIGTAAVRRLVSEGHGLERALLVVQHEAARRLAGVPRGGRFAALWAPWYAIEVAGRIPARAFRPVPRVDAAILTVAARRPSLLTPAAFCAHARVVEAAFGHGHGRTVVERLGRLAGRPATARRLLSAAGLPTGATPSQLPPEAWAAVTRRLLIP